MMLSTEEMLNSEKAEFMTEEDKQFYLWYHENYEDMLVESGKLDIPNCFYDGSYWEVLKTDPIMQRYEELYSKLYEGYWEKILEG